MKHSIILVVMERLLQSIDLYEIIHINEIIFHNNPSPKVDAVISRFTHMGN